MMAAKRKHWSRGMVDKNVAEDEEELLVFGYSCKLFRDDEKALYIEQGKHLIPWMGEDRLMIDRYDGRGYLHDIEQYEAKPGKDVHEGLTEEEIKIETICDEERYLALCKDMSEEEMYHEEEMKRLRMALASDGAYNEVNFTYDEETTKDSYDPSEPTDETGFDISEEPFIAPSELGVPEGMEVPPTGKMNAIIEKTAVFVAQHGIQMEIVIKTKQSKNTQFSFMQFDHPLNPYYKHMIKCIKSGKYKPSPSKKSGASKKIANGEDENNEDDDDEEDDENYDGSYLHPSLTASKPVSVVPQAYASSTYTDSYNYALNTSYASATPIQSFNTGTMQYQQQQRSSQSDDWYSLLVKQLKDKVSKSHSSTNSPANLTPPMGTGSPNSTPMMQPEYLADPALSATQYPMYMMTDPSLPTPPGLEPVTLPSSQDHALPPGIDAVALQSSVTASTYETDGHPSHRGTNNYLLRESHILPPPPDVQPIIDKMASYVAKNGKDFETVVLSKGDKRFEFLHSWHEFHAYYLFKKSMYEQQLRRLERPNESSEGDNISSAPISFSIRSKEPEAVPLEKRSALSLDENSDSDENSGKKERNEHSDKRNDTGKEAEKADCSSSDRKADEKRNQDESSLSLLTLPEKSKKSRSEAMEMRIAEDKLKDKLAAAAREKLASASREKQLQLERKRRAALFLTLLNKKDKTRNEEISTVIGPQLLPGMVPTSAPTTASSNSEEEITEYPPSEGSHSPREMLLPVLRDAKSSPKSDSVSPEKQSKDTSLRLPRHSHSRSRSRTPKYRKKKWQRRSRSRSRHRSRIHKRSRSRSQSKISKSKTPPAAYAVVRRSRSPSNNRQIHRSRSRSREKSYKRSHARSPSSRGHVDYRYRRSNSPAQYRSWRSRSRSKSINKLAISPKMPHRSRSRSKSSRSHSHRSHSKTKSSKASKSSNEVKKSPSSSPVSEDDKKERIQQEVKSKSRSVSPNGKTECRATEKTDGS